MMNRRRFLKRLGYAGLGLASARLVQGAMAENSQPPDGSQSRGMINGATQEAIDRGLAYLEGQQYADGSFGTRPHRGNVAITSLCGLAFMAGGHQPGRGRFGHAVNKAVEFLVSLEEQPGNAPPGYLFNRNPQLMQNGPMYGHGFGTLFLAEAYGMVQRPDLRERLRGTLQRAVRLIIDNQNIEGGWRYHPVRGDADISVTICQIMALRAAKNAGFTVPAEVAAKCTRYVERLQAIPGNGGFRYQAPPPNHQGDRFGQTGFARTAAGVVALYSAGVYEGNAVTRGLDYLMQNCKPGGVIQNQPWRQDMQMHYYYGHYYAVQAMWIAGGRYWHEWYPAIRDELVNHPDHNNGDGSWWDRHTFPHCPHYCTAMACIILQVPNNYLPIFQR
jgi:hypothetical protein